ncbi:MAG: T9SS type A sorting domain-containing protein [Flavobacterium sp.]|nr:MAG: T9SS type A sorting domain-containing protein [Flavobacterium sp.]
MKAKLLFATLICSVASFAQSPIEEYYGHNYSGVGVPDGNSHRSYIVVTSASTIDQSPTGANATWNFNDLSAAGTSVYDNQPPTGDEGIAYPGTTIVTTNSVTMGTVTTDSQAYFAADGLTAFTGVESTGLSITYTDNATVGSFPMNYGQTQTDNSAGTYTYTTFSGTFTGDITSTVDAYGTLHYNDFGYGDLSQEVTRLKVVQTLSLNYLVYTDIGSATITSYHYYRTGDLFPFFTSVSTDIVVPMLSINQSTTVLEAANPALLGTHQVAAAQALTLSPNPVSDSVHLSSGESLVIESIAITDANGRTVREQHSALADVPVADLQSGIYFIRIDTDRGSTIKKFIKQ